MKIRKIRRWIIQYILDCLWIYGGILFIIAILNGNMIWVNLALLEVMLGAYLSKEYNKETRILKKEERMKNLNG